MKNLVILDGNNMIFSWKELRSSLNKKNIHLARKRLASRMSGYFKKYKNLNYLLFFDGNDSPGRYSLKKDSNIIFSGMKSTADEKIIQFFKKVKNDFNNIIVISADKRLYSKIETFGGIAINSRDFIRKIKSKIEFSLRPAIDLFKDIYVQENPNKRDIKQQLLNLL